MGQMYATPTDLWQVCLPFNTLFNEPGFSWGGWSSITKVGTGSGLMKISNESKPLNNSAVVVSCAVGGEITGFNVFNASPPPEFKISLDGGVTYSPELGPSNDGCLQFPVGGFKLEFKNGSTIPSFVVGDTFSFSTTPSPEVLAILEQASRIVDTYLKSTYQLPLTEWGSDIVWCTCALARWEIIKRKGLTHNQDFDVYRPETEMAWLKDIAAGRVTPSLIETQPGKLYPDIMVFRQPFSTSWLP